MVANLTARGIDVTALDELAMRGFNIVFMLDTDFELPRRDTDDLLKQKLAMCAVVYDFTVEEEATERDAKRQILLEVWCRITLFLAHFQVAERAMFLWNNETVVVRITESREAIFPMCASAFSLFFHRGR